MMKVENIAPGTVFEGFLLVRSAEKRVASNGKAYMDIILADDTGTVSSKYWDANENIISVFTRGSIVKVRGQALLYNQQLQFKVTNARQATELDEVTIDDLVPSSPVSPSELLADIRAAVDAFENTELAVLASALLDDAGDVFAEHPAAKTLHHAVRGGLIWHTHSMFTCARAICGAYPRMNFELLATGIIAHDMSKLEELATDGITEAEYTAEGSLLGHITMGVNRVARVAREAGVSEEITMLVEHMVLSHHEHPEYGSPVKPMFPEAQVLHYLDIMDARLYEMFAALEPLDKNSLSGHIRGLDRRLYKHGLEKRES